MFNSQASDWERYSDSLSLKQEEALAAVRSVVSTSGAQERGGEDEEVEKGGDRRETMTASPVKEQKVGRGGGMEHVTTVDGIAAIHTRSEFYTWYSEMEATRASEAEATYKRHADMIEEHINACNEMLKSIDMIVEIFDALKASQRTISSRTDALKEQCDTLVSEREKLLSVSNMVKERLQHFNRLETLSSLFHAPVSASSDPQSILQGLADLDLSLEFTGKHPEYLESAKYNTKFQHLQSRALSLVKSYFQESISTAVAECKVAAKVIASDDTDSVGGAEITLQNVKFRAVAEPRLKELMGGVCQHDQIPSYQQLLKDCTSIYCTSRFELIRYSLFSQIESYKEEKVVDAMKRASECLSQTAEMEIQLYQHIFHGMNVDQTSSQLAPLFDSMCILMTAVIEPMIYAQILDNLDLLTELNAYLNSLMHNRSRGCIFNVSSLRKLVQGVETMIFRQAKVECSLRGEAILLDPKGLEFLQNVKPPLDISECKGHAAVDFPPVDKVIQTLKKLYPSVIHKDLFADFIRDVASELFAVIESGCETLVESKGEAYGAIFKLRQLSILMECLNSFPDLAFTGAKEQQKRGFAQLGRQLSTKIFSPFSKKSPQSSNTREELERKLTVSREFCILTCSQDVINPLLSFLTKVTAAKVSTQPESIKSLAFASVERVSHLSETVRDAIQGPLCQHIALLYMAMPEKELEEVVQTMRENVNDAFTQIDNILREEYTEEERKTIAFPTAEQTTGMLAV